jgi:hypothetical protein
MLLAVSVWLERQGVWPSARNKYNNTLQVEDWKASVEFSLVGLLG